MQISNHWLVILCVVVLTASHLPLAAQAQFATMKPVASESLRAGAAISNITPPVGSIMGNSYGITVSEGVRDSLYASTATVPLTAGGNALASEVQAIALGDEFALVGFPGDAFVELGLAAKLHSPFPHTIVSEQSANGSISYVPNRKAFPEGGYEVISARLAPGGGELLVDTTLSTLTELFSY